MATVVATKGPPKEPPQQVRRRTYVILSFWAVILLALPMWWKTTSIYRAELPFEQMLHVPYQPRLPLEIMVRSKSLSEAQLGQLIKNTQQSLDDLNEYPILHHRLKQGEPNERSDPEGKTSLDIVIEGGPDFGRSWLLATNTLPTLAIQYPSDQASALPKFMTETIQHVYMEEHISLAHQHTLYASNNLQAQQFLHSAPGSVVQEVLERSSRAFKYADQYHLTFSLFSASGAPSDWAIETALERHIQPLFKALSKTSNFSVTSQIQLYSAFSPALTPVRRDDGNGAYIRHSDLGAFVNAAEWPLSPSIGTGSTINFILYIPLRGQMPLSVEGGDSGSWLIPQWGGITILNPALVTNAENGRQQTPQYLSEAELREPFETFSTQLLTLLGVPTNDLPLSLRIQSHQRTTALSLFLRASSSLGSLARLANHLATIPVPKHVAALVDCALGQLSSAATLLGTGRTREALGRVGKAFRNSEKAFFDKSMVGQVYFPDEHKVAVYLPLLGPVGVPLAVALLREIKALVTSLRR